MPHSPKISPLKKINSKENFYKQKISQRIMKHLTALVDQHISLLVGEVDRKGRLKRITGRVSGHIRKVENPQGRDRAYFPDDNHSYAFQSDSGDKVRITKRGKHNKVRYTRKRELYMDELDIGNLNVGKIFSPKIERRKSLGYSNSYSKPS